MKKFLLIACTFSLFTIAVRAQSNDQPFTFGGGINLNLPTGNLSNGWTFGLGFQLQGELKFSNDVSGVATTGYTQYFGKTVDFGGFTAKTPNIGFIPFLVGARIYPSETFFIGGQVGFGTFTNTGGSGNSGFDFYPQLGFNGSGYQFILGYNVISVTAGSNSNLALTFIAKLSGNH